MDVRIRPAEARDRTLLMNLFNLYQNELGAYCDAQGVKNPQEIVGTLKAY